MAAALYETLPALDQQQLDAHLERCHACRKEWSSLQTVVAEIPREPIEFEGDLLPVLRQRLAEGAGRPARRLAWRSLSAVAAVALVLTIGLTVYPVPWGAVQSENMAELSPVQLSPVAKALVQAEILHTRLDFAGALQVYTDALRSHPKNALSGELQLRLAALEFEQFNRYPEAFDAYERLRTRYPDDFTASPLSIERFDLLAEANTVDFESLYALDAARNSSTDSFARLEEVLVRYPDKLVGELAVASLCDFVRNTEEDTESPLRTAALERVKERCNNPVAVAALNVTLGDAVWEEEQDAAKARAYYAEAAESGHQRLAERATLAMATLDAADPEPSKAAP